MSICLIEVNDLSKSFKKNNVISNLSLKIYSNKVYFLVGENGSGKSTFLKILVGLYKPSKGKVTRYYKKYSYAPEALIYKDKIKVGKYLTRVSKLLKIKRDLKKERLFMLEVNKHLNELSKGNQKKILLYLAILRDNEVVFLDEPFDGLDKDVKEKFVNYLKEHNDVCYIISTHDKKVIEEFENKEVIKFG